MFFPSHPPFISLIISACTSEGVIAYYWSQFDIPVEDLEIVPEFSEERVLEVLESGLKEQRRTASRRDIKISEVTASCRYHQGRGGGSRGGSPRARKMGTTVCLLQLAPDYDT